LESGEQLSELDVLGKKVNSIDIEEGEIVEEDKTEETNIKTLCEKVAKIDDQSNKKKEKEKEKEKEPEPNGEDKKKDKSKKEKRSRHKPERQNGSKHSKKEKDRDPKDNREKEKHRDKDRETTKREKPREKDRERERGRDKDRERFKDNKDKLRHSSSRTDRQKEKKRLPPLKTESKATIAQREKKQENDEYKQRVQSQLEEMVLTEEEQQQRQENLLEERRKRRLAILAKYSGGEPDLTLQEVLKEEIPIPKKEIEIQLPKIEPEPFVNLVPREEGVLEEPVCRTGSLLDLDMFGDSPALEAQLDGPTLAAALTKGDQNSALNENWDDADGYYRFRTGEILAERFQVFSSYGKGVFSTVLKAKDIAANDEEVAIKLIRNNETMHRAGLKELEILKLIANKDPESKRHIVRVHSHFEHKNHLCIVFEPMSMNLRQVIKKYGKSEGLSIEAVQIYAKQLFIALKHLRHCNILHADIKPDNILVADNKAALKICDLGSASYSNENEITPYLVSRFYRAPEIILGLPYSFPLDVWSVGCCLAELFTGKIMFPGKTNNEMLKLFMQVKGKFPKKLLRKAQFRELHFDENFNYLSKETEAITQKTIVKTIMNIQASRDLTTVLLPANLKLMDEDTKKVLALRDLLDKCFTLDPAKRMSVVQALHHPFLHTS